MATPPPNPEEVTSEKSTMVPIAEDLHRRLKRMALWQDTTIEAYVSQAIDVALSLKVPGGTEQQIKEANEPSDAVLIERSQAGDRRSFEQLVIRYRGKVYAMTVNMIHNEAIAWDLAQDAFAKAWKALPRFEARSNFYTWLYRIAHNVIYDWLRKRAIQVRNDESTDQVDKVTSHTNLEAVHGERLNISSRILIVDNQVVFRLGISSVISTDTDLEVCGSVGSVNDALELIPQVKPSLVISDLFLPDRSGIELIRELRLHWPKLPVLIVSAHDEMIYAEQVLKAGGRGYLMKEESEQLLKAIRTVLAGQVYVAPSVLNLLIDSRSEEGGYR